MQYFTDHKKEIKDWGTLKIARVIPDTRNLWGVFHKLVQFPEWKSLFSVVSGESVSNALYGYINQFIAEVGDLPSLKLSRITKQWLCSSHKGNNCGIRSDICFPGSGSVPLCYKYPLNSELIEPVTQLIDYIKDGFYIVIVTGTGFSLKTTLKVENKIVNPLS